MRTTGRRIAFVMHTSTSDLEAGKADVTAVYGLLTQDRVGACDKKGSPEPFYGCPSSTEFHRHLNETLENWNSSDQLIFYFSGHGDYLNGIYCLQLGPAKADFLPFSSLLTQLSVQGVVKAILIIDACYSGEATKSFSPIAEKEIPAGIAILASSGPRQPSEELKDKSGSVFTELFCEALSSGMDGQKTPDGQLYAQSIVDYANGKLSASNDYESYAQRARFKVAGAESDIWIAHNRSGKQIQDQNLSAPSFNSIRSYDELRYWHEHAEWDLRPCPGATIEVLDWDLVYQYAEQVEPDLRSAQQGAEIVKELELFSPVPPDNRSILHNAAVLCFAKKPDKFFQNATCQFIVQYGSDRKHDYRLVRGPLLRQFEELNSAVINRLGLVPLSVIEDDGIRRPSEDIASLLIRELIGNAIIHRDYTLDALVDVRLTPSWLEIQSPGSFPKNLSWDLLTADDSIRSWPRSKRIAWYMHQLGAVERAGRGFDVVRSYLLGRGSASIAYQETGLPTQIIRVARDSILSSRSDRDLPWVFLSYSHDSDEHRDRVLALADRLRADGIDAHLDQYETSPAEGWPRWMRRQITNADFVLVVATAIYERRFRGEEEEGKGLGVRWDGAILTQELYEAGAETTTFVPVVFSRQDASHIPILLRPFTWHDISTADGYEQLYRCLTDQPEVVRPDVGKPRTLPPRPPRSRSGSDGTAPTIFMVPYHRNPYFTGREDVLAVLHEALTRSGSAALSQAEPSAALPQGTRTAISGLGGIGKTQTAVEYAYRHADEYRAVFFVRAETEGELQGGYFKIAAELDLPEATAGDQEVVFAGVRKWLETEDGWLLIFDNADRPDIVKPFLPRRHQGHVLVTSRAQTFHSVGIRHPFHLETLPPGDALAFLLARAEREEAGAEEVNAAAELAEELAYLPLALEQAGAYVLEQQLRFASYLTAYRDQGLELLGLAVAEEHPDPVTTTWAMNMRELGDASPTSADLLRACAFLAPNDVPEEFLTEGAAELGPAIAAVRSASGALAVGELLAPLVRYSLITRDLERRALSVHRLVQEVVRASLSQADRRLWVERVIHALRRALPWPEFSTWPACGRLLPHVLAATGLPEARDPEIEETGHLLNSAAWYLYERARYAEAEPLFERSLKIREKALGDEHPDVASSLNNLAELYRAQGRLAEAEPLIERSLKIRERALGDEHPNVASSLNNLALLYREQGRLAEAEPLYERSLKIREKALGDEHPDVASSLNNLAFLYSEQGRRAEAEPLYERSLKIREKALGDEHPNVATALENYAILLRDTGRTSEAEEMEARARTIRERHAARERQRGSEV